MRLIKAPHFVNRDKRWRIVYEEDDGKQRTRTFKTEKEAQARAQEVTGSSATGFGTAVPPPDGSASWWHDLLATITHQVCDPGVGIQDRMALLSILRTVSQAATAAHKHLDVSAREEKLTALEKAVEEIEASRKHQGVSRETADRVPGSEARRFKKAG